MILVCQTGHLTVRNDVYRFGVVLLELLTGRRSVDKTRLTKEQSLMDWARPKLKGKKKWLLIIDPRLEDQYSIRAAQKACSLAYYCLSNNHKARPLTTDIAETLEHLQGNCTGDAAITFISPLTGGGSASGGYTKYQSGRSPRGNGCSEYMMMVADVGSKTGIASCSVAQYGKYYLFYKSVWMMHNIIHFYNLANQTKEALLVMEYCDKSLVSVLESRGAGFFEEEHILLMFNDICKAVFAMHYQSPPIAHRFVFVSDVGLVLREVISEKVDIWALGCLLFRICYFKSAFDGESNLQVLNRNYRIPESPKYGPSITNDML
ncbi:probable serine/threonine-protein kinase PBL8 [Tanacetum coccineum]